MKKPIIIGCRSIIKFLGEKIAPFLLLTDFVQEGAIMITEEYCLEILKKYPEYITKDQMYRICHISKKTCLFLLENKLVPNIDSGKKTRRFKIKTTDVINYLKDREINPWLYKAPSGYYIEFDKPKTTDCFLNFSKYNRKTIRLFYEKMLMEYPDVMNIYEVAEFTGYNKNSVIKWCNKGYLKCFNILQKYKIPKEYLLDFLISDYYINIFAKSAKHITCNKKVYEIYKYCL